MKPFFTKFWGIIMLTAILSSCSSLENLSVKWKYRNDYHVKKSVKPKAAERTKEISLETPGQPVKGAEREIKTVNASVIKNNPLKEVQIKNTLAGAAIRSKTSSKPASVLEKKMVKLHKKIKRANENGSTWGGLAFVFGLAGLVGLFFYGPLVILSLFAVLFGIIGISGNKNGQGLAIIGLLLGILTLLILLGGITLFSAAFF